MVTKEDLNKTGVYQIKNLVNSKIYIGQTMVSFKARWAAHKYELNKGIHMNCHLQRSWDKYSSSNFEFSILEIYDNIEDCNKAEERLIRKHNSLSSGYGYNIKYGGDNYIVLEETRQRMRDAWTEERALRQRDSVELHYLLRKDNASVDLYEETIYYNKDYPTIPINAKPWEDSGFTVFDVELCTFDTYRLHYTDEFIDYGDEPYLEYLA